MKTLVIYYSQACGNTRRIAEMIHQVIPSDITEIETVQPYEGSYEEIVEQGKHEVENGTMPAIKPLSVKIEDYDRIILGTPTWWYTMAPAVRTFLDVYDLSDKEVVLLQTHGGWQGHAFKDMKAIIKGNVSDEFAVQFDDTGGDELVTDIAVIRKWINTLSKGE
ncbi:MAG: NAD(P)H-dependent oxidoreductase [Ruminococcus sp.]|nr:NAD(P)H-dependent oxidoreductase [Ruminococcus sp.]